MSASANISKVVARLKQARAIGRIAARRGLERAARARLARAVGLAPGASGHLKASAAAMAASEAGERMEAVIGFTAAYAAVVHEDLAARHDDGQAKFLETAVREGKDDIAATIAAEVKAAL